MKEFFTYLVKNLVDQPDSVDIQVVEQENQTLVEIRVAQKDISKVIGRQGRMVNSLRTLAITIGARFGKRVRLEVVNDEGASEEASEGASAT
jgi:predicted RNA-binding protein YlqC (UPF0109 family)